MRRLEAAVVVAIPEQLFLSRLSFQIADFKFQIVGRRGRSPLHFSCCSPVPAPPYFCSHFNSSRTLIFPFHGFLSSGCPSPGKISNVLGMPRECRAWSSR